MREIKFRIWDKEDKVMYRSEIFDLGLFFSSYNYETNPLMQYTGFKDKNGKEIYEDDILIMHRKLKKERHLDESSGKWVTTERETPLFRDYSVRAFFTKNGKWMVENKKGGVVNNLHALEEKGEVIGNYFENPELLK